MIGWREDHAIVSLFSWKARPGLVNTLDNRKKDCLCAGYDDENAVFLPGEITQRHQSIGRQECASCRYGMMIEVVSVTRITQVEPLLYVVGRRTVRYNAHRH